MPKKPSADKKTRARNRLPNSGFRKAPASINDLLRRRAALTTLVARVPEQQAWAAWLRSVLPPELAGHIVNVVPKERELVVLADSSAWCARLRYALAALETEIRSRDAAMQQTRVRVSIG
jgi:Dna[CI] antecedent, DciA